MFRILKNIIRLSITALLIIIIVSCVKHIPDGPPPYDVDVRKIPNAKPHPLPLSKYGNPSTYVIRGKQYHVLKTAKGYNQYGVASWYGTKFHGELTSSREPYNMLAMTAASPVLPIPSFVRVTNLRNHQSVIVKVNDRGPFVDNRIIDLSYAAAKKLGYADRGTAFVEVQAITNFSTQKTQSKKSLHKQSPIFLQLGSFHQFSQAQHLSTHLKALIKKPVTVYKIQEHHLAIYRIKIGPLANVTESNRLQSRLKKLGFSHVNMSFG